MSLKNIARNLRQKQTAEEAGVWRALRGRRFAGFKFRRQHIVGEHVLDFFCADAKLAVELDGFQHGSPDGLRRDKAREEYLRTYGIETFRLWNHQWRKNREGCLMDLWNALQQRSWVRITKNAEEQKFIPPELKKIKLNEKTDPSP